MEIWWYGVVLIGWWKCRLGGGRWGGKVKRHSREIFLIFENLEEAQLGMTRLIRPQCFGSRSCIGLVAGEGKGSPRAMARLGVW